MLLNSLVIVLYLEIQQFQGSRPLKKLFIMIYSSSFKGNTALRLHQVNKAKDTSLLLSLTFSSTLKEFENLVVRGHTVRIDHTNSVFQI